MKLNKRQGIALWVGIAIVAILALFPPVQKVTPMPRGKMGLATHYVGYQFLYRGSGYGHTKDILIGRWVGQVAMAALLATGVIVALNRDEQ